MKPLPLTTAWLWVAMSFASDPLQSPSDVPAWVERGTYAENGITYLVAQTNEKFAKARPADAALDDAIRDAIQNYFEQQSGQTLPRLEISASEIQNRLLVPENREVKLYDEAFSPELAQRLGGVDHDTYYRAFAQIQLDAKYIESTQQWLHREFVRQRLRIAALIGLGSLAMLGVLFGYLRIDHATRGYYNRRLQTAAIVVALTIAAAVYWGLSFYKL